MKTKIILPLVTTIGATFITGCATDAHYIQTGGPESVVTVGQINIKDYNDAATDAVNDMLNSDELAKALDKVTNSPAKLVISRIANSTGQQIDTDLLTKTIRVALSKSGKFQTTTTLGLGGTAEDPLAKGIQQETDFMNDQQTTRLPDFSLSGKIIQIYVPSGNVRESTDVFQLSLTDNQGQAVWEGQKQISKQSKRGAVSIW
jgi:penicillin-binding protein activator